MRSRTAFTLLLCASACFIHAQEEKPASVSGSVVNSVTGAGVPRAQIHLRADSGDQSYGAMTTSEGRFSIASLPAGVYSVEMDRPGFSMPDDPPEDIVLQAGEKKDSVRLSLVPAGSISGRVTNADGDPVENVDIVAETSSGDVTSFSISTDAKGQFRIGGLAPGRYRVRAMPENRRTPPETRSDGTADTQDAPTYYPSALTFRQALPVNVSPGADTPGIEIRLAHIPIVEVSGKAEAPEGAFNPRLLIADGKGGESSTPAIKPDGTFRLWRLNPGKYEIRALWQLPGGRDAASAPVGVEISGANIDNLNLHYVASSDLTGHVIFEDDRAKPAPGMIRKLVLTNAGLRGGVVTADIDADGSFRIPHISPGRYHASLTWDKVYVASAQVGSLPPQGSLLDLAAGAGGDITIRASSAVGSISGNVKGIPGRQPGVTLISDEPGILPQPAFVDPDGHYSFGSVAPGKYRIFVSEITDSYSIMRLADEFRDQMESVEVHPGEKVSVDLKRSILEAER